jgi:hypothetical protein
MLTSPETMTIPSREPGNWKLVKSAQVPQSIDPDFEPPDPRIETTRKRRLSAERLISELWQFTLRREDMARTSEVDPRLLRILNRIGELGTDAIGASILGLQDTDVQVRRNSGLILLDLSARINISEALPYLRASLQDSDANLRDLARQAIAGINR